MGSCSNRVRQCTSVCSLEEVTLPRTSTPIPWSETCSQEPFSSTTDQFFYYSWMSGLVQGYQKSGAKHGKLKTGFKCDYCHRRAPTATGLEPNQKNFISYPVSASPKHAVGYHPANSAEFRGNVPVAVGPSSSLSYGLNFLPVPMAMNFAAAALAPVGMNFVTVSAPVGSNFVNVPAVNFAASSASVPVGVNFPTLVPTGVNFVFGPVVNFSAPYQPYLIRPSLIHHTQSFNTALCFCLGCNQNGN